MLTQQRLKELLQYDPETGLFTRLQDKGPSKKGTVAGTKRTKDGYISISIDYKKYQAHRLVFLYMTGTFPLKQVDHINRDREDNRFNNLRHVSPQENQHNNSLSKKNTSGVTGVSWNKGIKKWHAYIKVNYKRINLGFFNTIEEAKEARENAKVRLHPSSPEARALSMRPEF